MLLFVGSAGSCCCVGAQVAVLLPWSFCLAAGHPHERNYLQTACASSKPAAAEEGVCTEEEAQLEQTQQCQCKQL